MKTIFLFTAGLLLCGLQAAGQTADSLAMKAPTFSLGNLFHCKRDLRAGTPIFLETLDAVATENAVHGQPISFRVRENVQVEGHVVVAAGALAKGRVKSIEPSTYNQPEKIQLEALYVQAVTGEQVPLTGEASWVGEYPNQGMALPPGALLSAQVLNDLAIKL